MTRSSLSMHVIPMLFMIATFASSALAQSADELLDFVLTQHEAARERIETVEVEYSFEQLVDEERLRAVGLEVNPLVTGTATTIASGPLRWFDTYREGLQYSTPGEGFHNRGLINENYIGLWPSVGQAMAYQYDIPSAHEIPDVQANYAKVATPANFLNYGFGRGGNGKLSLREMIEQFSEGFIWTMGSEAASEGHELYVIRRHFEKGGKLDAEYVIDPAQGYFITSIKGYEEDGTLFWETKVKGEEIAPGVWFPVEIYEHTEVGDFRATVERIQVNQPVDPAQFELEALGYDKETIRIVRTPLEGELITMQYEGGQLVPIVSKYHFPAKVEAHEVPAPLRENSDVNNTALVDAQTISPLQRQSSGGPESKRTVTPLMWGLLLVATVSGATGAALLALGRRKQSE